MMRMLARVSGTKIVAVLHGIDSTHFQNVASISGHERTDAMPSHNTVLNGLLKHVPMERYEALCREHGIRSRSLTPRRHLVALLYAQFSGAEGLRASVSGMATHKSRLYHAGGAPVARSTLADANAYRSADVFGALFTEMVAKAQSGFRKKTEIEDATYLIDATSVDLNSLSAQWAEPHWSKYRAKVHVVHDADAGIPIHAVVTPSKTSDIEIARSVPIEKGATYVFDMGYCDFTWWAKLVGAGCTIVTRFKRNTKLREVEERPLPEGSAALSDRIGKLPARMARSRKNPMQVPVREVRVMTETGKELRILTNDLEATADEVGALYKRRWHIELFFRWIKQNLRIRRFHGTSENAVRIQVAIALIAYLIIHLAHALQTAIPSPTHFIRTLRSTLMQRRAAEILTDRPPPKPDIDTLQTRLNLTHAAPYA